MKKSDFVFLRTSDSREIEHGNGTVTVTGPGDPPLRRTLVRKGKTPLESVDSFHNFQRFRLVPYFSTISAAGLMWPSILSGM